MRVERIPYTTTAAGAATVYSRNEISGRVHVVRYVADDSDQADGTIAVTGDTTGISILAVSSVNAANDATYYPKADYHLNSTGAAETGDASHTETCLLHERIKIVLTNHDNTGAAATGVFYVGYTD